MIFKKTFLVITAMLSTATSQAADWIYQGGITGKEVSIYIDHESLKRTSSRAQAWTKWEYSDVQRETSTSGYPRSPYQSVKELYLFDCANQSFSISQGVAYHGDSVVDHFAYDSSKLSFASPPPGSIIDSILTYACQTTES